MVVLRTNEAKLVMMSVMGMVTAPMQRGAYRVDREGVPFVLPGVGGITYNVKVGDHAFGWAGDHVEPGVSTAAVNDVNRSEVRNQGYNTLSCVGNGGTVMTGEAKGAKGTVTGMHGGIEHVIMDFADSDMDKLAIEDKILVRAYGLGLQLLDYPGIMVKNLDPGLLERLPVQEKDGQLVVGVAGRIPGKLMGSGIGAPDTHSGDYDITTTDQEEIVARGIDKLCFGDLVALEDCDNRFGRSFRSGALTIGVVVHSDCLVAGHGPGVTTLFTAIDGTLAASDDSEANVGKLLGIGRYRQ